MTLREATAKWAGEWNAMPRAVIERLISDGRGEWKELTMPTVGDGVEIDGRTGEIVSVLGDEDERRYVVRFDDDGSMNDFRRDAFDVVYEDVLPMWEVMWTFGDGLDDDWLEHGGIEALSECGYRVYDIEDLGYCFGIDGAGYDFYKEHHIPLYKRRGLCWHDNDREE